MSGQPYTAPSMSRFHQKLVRQFGRKFAAMRPSVQDAQGFFARFKAVEALRYIAAAADHCIYCGSHSASLDLDHFKPIGAVATTRVDEEKTIEQARIVAGASLASDVVDNRELLVKEHEQDGYPHLAIAPENIVPACHFCNQRRVVRMYDDSRRSCGKHNRFPVRRDKNGGEVPYLINPAEVNWSDLRRIFSFTDIVESAQLNSEFESPQSAPRSGRFRNWGSARLTLVAPSSVQMEAAKYDERARLEVLRAITTIELLGLNRKSLSEDRFRHRELLRLKLLLGVDSIAECLEDDDICGAPMDLLEGTPNSVLEFAGELRAWICTNPHQLALIDVLVSWLHDTLGVGTMADFDVDQFMEWRVG